MTDDSIAAALAEIETDAGASSDGGVPCRFICGVAGSGKTFSVAKRAAEEPGWALLTSTTGVSAVNLGAVTINSALGFFDEASLRDAYLQGRLQRAIHEVGRDYRWIAVDEGSMMGGPSLDLLKRGVQEANQYADMVGRPLGILFIADFAQLPPVNQPWAFEADCWPMFASHMTKLTKVWRQADGPFLDALNLLRAGRGGEASEVLTAAGATWHTVRDENFPGTTIVPVNAQVSRHNAVALDHVRGERFVLRARRWGKQRGEWGLNPRTHEWGIPPEAEFKVGAYVMCLANRPDFTVVNGDCGTIVAHDPEAGEVVVRLVRTGREETIGAIVRSVTVAEAPEGFAGPTVDYGEYVERPHRVARRRGWVVGQVEYVPLRLAYCSTCHKSQSLTLDRVQIDYRHHWFGQCAMLYVAMSRCRTLAGLRLVGMRETFVKQCKADLRVKEWL